MSWLDEVPWVEELVIDMRTGEYVKRRLRPMVRNAAGAWVDPYVSASRSMLSDAIVRIEQTEADAKRAAINERNPGIADYVNENVLPRMRMLELDGG